MIHLSDIHKSYFLSGREETVLKGIDLDVHAGEMVALMGPSGSGKSTLMNIVGLLDRPTRGSYQLDKQEVSSLSQDALAKLRNEKIGFVFQQFFLLPKLNALQNVCMPLTYRGVPKEDAIIIARQKLHSVGVDEYWHHKPAELSGGQQQRVAIARALVTDPSLILADEPTGALDSKTGQEVMDILKKLNQEQECTIVVVTHDESVAKQCQKTVRLKDGVTQS